MILALLITMRPRQWLKNGLVYAPLFFDSKLIDLESFLRTTAAFVLLCLMSGAVYIMNDLIDIENDRQHPTKKNRPLASGGLNPTMAGVAAVILIVGTLIAGFYLSVAFGFVLLVYFLVQVVYSIYLKNIVLLDVLTISAGFVLRVAAGVAIINVERFSPWLYVCTGFLALFIALGKRRQELILLGADAGHHRSILDEYTIDLIDRLNAIVTTSAVVAYSLYTFLAVGLPANNLMMLTIPFVLYAVFRYLFLIHVRHEGGAPEEIFLRDRPMQASMILWALVVFLVLYIIPSGVT